MDYRLGMLQAISWCRAQSRRDDPRWCLRSDRIRPSVIRADAPTFRTYSYEWLSGAPLTDIVNEVVHRRSIALEDAGLAPLAQGQRVDGRLLLNYPYNSDYSCLSDECSDGYIDECDVPPWDTWIASLNQTWPGNSVNQTGPCLICFVPDLFVPAVQSAIDCNPMENLAWCLGQPQSTTDSVRELVGNVF
jgi:hypothetical protein